MEEDQTERLLPLCNVPSGGVAGQADFCKAYIEVMRKMCGISKNADPQTVAFIFGRSVPDAAGVVSTRPIMVSAALLSIDSFAPVVIQERRKNRSVNREIERRFHSWIPETEGTAFS